MSPALEALGPDGGVSLAGAALRTAIALLALIAAAWAVARWRRRWGTPKRRLQVLERTFLARGASVALVEVEGRRLLVGVSNDGVRLLRDFEESGGPQFPKRFAPVLADVAARREAGP